MKTCRWCHKPVRGTTDESPNWWCQPCNRFDAVRCIGCGTTDGFPVSLAGHEARPLFADERVYRKSWVYCRRCLHGTYFSASVDEDTRRCILCDTRWNRLVSAVHAWDAGTADG